MTVAALQRNVASIIQNIDEIVLRSAMENDNFIVDLNTSQLSEGLRSDGTTIKPEYYTKEYAKLKKSMGARPQLGTPDLKYSGDFYQGFYVKKVSDWLEIHSTDWKEKQLRLKYSDEIFGLTDKSKKELGEFILPILLKNLRNELKSSKG